jgi:putative addiction module CopG family antidote
MSTLNLELSDELTQLIAQSLESGHYKTEEDVVLASLVALKQLNDRDSRRLYALQAEINKGLTSKLAEGTLDEIFARVQSRAISRHAAS